MYAVFGSNDCGISAMDKVRRLEMVVRAADLGGFAAAAKHLNITPSAVSRGIAELERALRISIFMRSTRHIQLTEEGRELYHRAVDVLERLAAMEVTANAVDKQVRGTIHVGIMPPLSRHVVMPQLAGFLDAHPNLRIDFHVTQDTKAIQSENIDVLLHVGEPPPSRLIAHKLGQGRPAAYASPAYVARHGELKDPDELRAHRCLAFKPDWLAQPYVRWTFTKGARTKTIKINPAIVTSDREALLIGATSSAGIIFMACFDPGLIASRQLIRLFPEWSCKPSFNIYALYRDKSAKAPRVASFLSFVQRSFRDFDRDEHTILHAGSFNSQRPNGRGVFHEGTARKES
jgi:DNA-binding transcriptional LysR family regulator